MRKALILLMLLLWGIITSSRQCKPIEQRKQPTLIKSLDSLNNSLDRLKIAIDERD